jgi:alkylhydroperoxidase family enzyme
MNCELLRRVTLDEDLVRALEQDYTQGPITRADRVMLDYVVQLTKDATQIGPQDHERLRSEGFDDRAVLQITLIASRFNYINRVADALGFGRESASRTVASSK